MNKKLIFITLLFVITLFTGSIVVFPFLLYNSNTNTAPNLTAEKFNQSLKRETNDYTTVSNVPINQEVWITWDPITRKGNLEVRVYVNLAMYKSFKKKDMDFGKTLENTFNKPVSEEMLKGDIMRYTVKIPIKGDLTILKDIPLFSNGQITVNTSTTSNLVEKVNVIKIHTNPAEYLHTSNVESIIYFQFPKNHIVKIDTDFTTNVHTTNKNQVAVYLTNQTPMELAIKVTYLNMPIIYGVIIVSLVILAGIACIFIWM
ncbi:hypothetical protein [Thermoanaerobacter mathranii]|uniref:hypothetical protein n=1 Tax=Thermoanaerobacter mathranii TaxID=583357 RepID=UPI003D6C0F97